MASYDPRRCGAKGDGLSKDTEALQKAADACAAAGGGTLLLGPGRYLSGTVRLSSNTVLRIEQGATLLGSQDRADYLRFFGSSSVMIHLRNSASVAKLLMSSFP